MSIGTTLGTQHHRMLLEDIMGLSVGTEIVYLIHQSHIFIAGEKPTWWSRRIHLIAKDKKSRCHLVKFQNNLYWAVQATVRNNPEKDNFHKRIYTEEDSISKGCTQKGGWGITVELSTEDKKESPIHRFHQTSYTITDMGEGYHIKLRKDMLEAQ